MGSGQSERPCWHPAPLMGEMIAELQGWATLAWHWAAAWRDEHRRPREWWMATLMLTVATVSAVLTAYAAFRAAPSAARLSFRTGVKEGSGGLRSFATPEPGDTLSIRLQLIPYNQDLGAVSVAIDPPPQVELTDRCYYTVGGSARRDCALPDGEGRIDLPRLDSGETFRLSVEAHVVGEIRDRESITIEMSSAEAEASRRDIDLYSPHQGVPGEPSNVEFVDAAAG